MTCSVIQKLSNGIRNSIHPLSRQTYSYFSMAALKRKNATENDDADAKKQTRLTAFMKLDDKVVAPSDGFQLRACLKDKSWSDALITEFNKPYFKAISEFLKGEYAKGKEVFPPKDQIFNAFDSTPLKNIKVVIIGQDPYHDNGQAHGLCFSVKHGVAIPPSLKNIYKELESDIDGFKAPKHGNLQAWANQGVFLLNATLTVEAHKANSHEKCGWQQFTDSVIKMISDECKGVVFILWGGFAQKKEMLIDAKKHKIIKAAHPSPLSVSKFLGCHCFSAANASLVMYGKTAIDWKLA